jgi:hypothetical protein
MQKLEPPKVDGVSKKIYHITHSNFTSWILQLFKILKKEIV